MPYAYTNQCLRFSARVKEGYLSASLSHSRQALCQNGKRPDLPQLALHEFQHVQKAETRGRGEAIVQAVQRQRPTR